MRRRPVFKASKFREIAAFAKRTTGICFGLIDSAARYRKKRWKSTEGHRQFLRLKQHSPLTFIHFQCFPPNQILSHLIQITAVNEHGSPYVSYILRFFPGNELIVHSSSSPPRGIHSWGFPNIVLCWCKAGPPHVSFNQK